MTYGGVEVEMMGSLHPLSLDQLPSHLNHRPTRAQVMEKEPLNLGEKYEIIPACFVVFAPGGSWPVGTCGVPAWPLHPGSLWPRLPLPQVGWFVSEISLNNVPAKVGETRRGWRAATTCENQCKGRTQPIFCDPGTNRVAGPPAPGLVITLVWITTLYRWSSSRYTLLWWDICTMQSSAIAWSPW